MDRREALSRRNFLAAGCAGLASWFLGGSVSRAAEIYYRTHHYDDELKIWLDSDDGAISFEEAAQLVKRLDKVCDTFDYVPEITPEAIAGWTEEILSFFYSEGIVSDVKRPTSVELRSFLETGQMGWSDCQTGVWLNERMADSFSLLYRSPMFLPRLIHELFHLQQGIFCEIIEPDLVEGITQIVTWQILAAIANSGRAENRAGREAAYALATELRDVALSTAAAVTLRSSDEDSIRKLVKQISPSALADSRLERALRKYRRNPARALRTLERYSEKPLARVFRAHKETGDKIYGLPLDPGKVKYIGGGSPYVVDYDSVLEIDDIVFFLGHVEDMIAEYNQ